MVDQIIHWANNNPVIVDVLLFVLLIFATIIGYLLKRFLFSSKTRKTLKQQQKGGDNSTNLQSGRDTNIFKTRIK